ncbi:hypothetical protein KEM56_002741 [Ascosphaera pollenicola]|nr:hypothetical protein KEM56_002741 [Ascosphaera pollenicola]
MLSGGDLDGDLYNVIYDETLMPGMMPYEPAEYPPTEERVLDRPVETADIIDFFVTFMQQDQLGRIATLHQILADQCPNGTVDQECLSLAELHSAAVDFSKSGTPADLSKMPRVKPYRPDFMAPGPRVRIADDIGLVQENDIASKIDFDDPADDDEPRPMQYYKSHKILGVLYRAIDENKFFKEIKDAIEPSSTNVNVLDQVWKYVQSQVAGFQWEHLTEKAEGIKELYEGQMHTLMSNFSETSWTGACITEYEVILGTILGQGQKQSRLNKEQSKSLRDEYEELVDLVVSTIHDSEEARSEGLELSVACFHIAIRDHELYMNFAHRVSSRNRDSTKVLSFAWIAATVCLKEVIKLKRENIPVFLT